MAAVVTQIASGSTTTNPTTTLTIATTQVDAGDVVLVAAMYHDSTPTPTATIGGNTMTLDGSGARAGAAMGVIFRYDATGTIASGQNIVITWTAGAGAGAALTACKVSGLTQGGENTTSGSNSGLSSTPTTGASGTPPAGDDCFVFAALGVAWGGTGTATADNSYSELTKVEEGVRGSAIYAAYNSFTAAVAAKNESWTATFGTLAWGACICVYKITAAPTGFTNTVPPTVSGNLAVGSTLTASPGTWTPTPGSFTYYWRRADDTSGTNLVEIGATGSTYTLDAADNTKYLQAGVIPHT